MTTKSVLLYICIAIAFNISGTGCRAQPTTESSAIDNNSSVIEKAGHNTIEQLTVNELTHAHWILEAEAASKIADNEWLFTVKENFSAVNPDEPPTPSRFVGFWYLPTPNDSHLSASRASLSYRIIGSRDKRDIVYPFMNRKLPPLEIGQTYLVTAYSDFSIRGLYRLEAGENRYYNNLNEAAFRQLIIDLKDLKNFFERLKYNIGHKLWFHIYDDLTPELAAVAEKDPERYFDNQGFTEFMDIQVEEFTADTAAVSIRKFGGMGIPPSHIGLRLIKENPWRWRIAAINRYNYSIPRIYDVTSTVFWIGEPSNTASAWDDDWQEHFGGVDHPNNRNGYFPSGFTPKENPFYCALPYNDFKSGRRDPDAADLIPWAATRIWAPKESMCKNRWIEIYKKDKICYAQWEDVGPFNTDDSDYVFSYRRPANKKNQSAGIDVSPAVRDYLGLADIDTVRWRFVDKIAVPDGPWEKIVTTSQINWR